MLSDVSASVGLLLPFAAFAGGVACGSTAGRKNLKGALVAGLIAGIGSYAVSAWATPLAEYAVDRRVGVDLDAQRPFGPATPPGLLRNRRYVIANPPARYGFSVERRGEIPPNWLTLGLWLSIALLVFAAINSALGQLAAAATTGLSPPARRNARWAIGLLGGLAFFLAMTIAEDRVRGSFDVSGVAGAWLPLLVPVSELLLLVLLVRRRDHRLHALQDADV